MARDLDDGPDHLQPAAFEVHCVVTEPDGLAPSETGAASDDHEPAVPVHHRRNELPRLRA